MDRSNELIKEFETLLDKMGERKYTRSCLRYIYKVAGNREAGGIGYANKLMRYFCER